MDPAEVVAAAVVVVQDAVLVPDEARAPVRDAGQAQALDVASVQDVEPGAAQGDALDAGLGPFLYAEDCHRARAARMD